MRHKYDKRGAGEEGEFAENLFREACRARNESIRKASLKEDAAGVDFYLDGKPIDIKGRKFRLPPNSCWIEVSASGGKLRTGWSFKSKLIGQLMAIEENGAMLKAQFGIYHTDDLVNLMETKVDFASSVFKAELYKLYTRWFDGLHRGTMTVLPYSDLMSLDSFRVLEIPQAAWPRIIAFYGYK